MYVCNPRARAHPGCTLVTSSIRQLEKLVSSSLAASFARANTLRIESSPCETHLWTTLTPGCRSFAFTGPRH